VECFAGLSESAVPIRLGDQVLAYLLTGQMLFRRPAATRARKAVRLITDLDPGIKPAELQAAYRKTPVINRRRYQAILRLLEIFASQLSGLSNRLMIDQAMKDTPAIARARAYIAQHMREEISLPQVSRVAGMSTFYFCKHFKRGTSLTFVEYLSRLRVEAAKQLMLDPYKRVSEAAFAVGFQSLSQFNRTFHRFTGQAPSVYRRQLHAPSRNLRPRSGVGAGRLTGCPRPDGGRN
jgi:AraC-like DNA-binding protein